MQASSTVLSIAALFWGFLQAPFLHIHAEELEHRSASPAHLHFPSTATGPAPILGAPTADEDSIEVEWGIAPPSAVAFVFELAVSEAVIIEPPRVVSAHVAIPKPRSHDPPDLRPNQPRSPPA